MGNGTSTISKSEESTEDTFQYKVDPPPGSENPKPATTKQIHHDEVTGETIVTYTRRSADDVGFFEKPPEVIKTTFKNAPGFGPNARRIEIEGQPELHQPTFSEKCSTFGKK